MINGFKGVMFLGHLYHGVFILVLAGKLESSQCIIVGAYDTQTLDLELTTRINR